MIVSCITPDLLWLLACSPYSLFFFFTATATTEIYTLSLHDALPIFLEHKLIKLLQDTNNSVTVDTDAELRSEEHTSELQSHSDLVCRLLLEKKKTKKTEQHMLDTITNKTTKQKLPAISWP